MKCDELKPLVFSLYDLAYVDESAVKKNLGNPHNHAVYKATEVDEAIAELKARIQLDDDEMAGFLQLEEECGGGDLRNYIAELKQKLEDAKASHYAEMVDAGMRERRLNRALWIARAERAIAEAEYWYGHTSGMYYIDAKDVPDEEDDPYKRVKDTTIGWYKTWMNVERKCRAKAEEYK